jgi:hypothetical protein
VELARPGLGANHESGDGDRGPREERAHDHARGEGEATAQAERRAHGQGVAPEQHGHGRRAERQERVGEGSEDGLRHDGVPLTLAAHHGDRARNPHNPDNLVCLG